MEKRFEQIVELVLALREAGDDAGSVNAVVDASCRRLAEDAEYRVAVRTEVRELLGATSSTHPLTEIGILSDEPLAAGIVRRMGAHIAPAPPRAASIDSLLGDFLSRNDVTWLEHLGSEPLRCWVDALLGELEGWDDRRELSSAMIVLATRVAAAGLDSRLSERMPSLEGWTSPFIELSRVIDRYAERYARGEEYVSSMPATVAAIGRCTAQVTQFRAEKEQLGTTLHLSSASLRMLQQLDRLRWLVSCTIPGDRSRAVAELLRTLGSNVCRSRPLRDFVQQKLDLLAFLVVGHAAQKGDKYAARSRRDYWSFWAKSLLGGVIVAVFATLKPHLSTADLAPVPQAILYGLNYAVCFVLIYAFGATLATKQPGLTASRIADALEEGPGHEPFPELVRAIWRSQFVSFLGNIAAAALFAVFIALGYEALVGRPIITADVANKLADSMHPAESGTIWYAAVAGVMLSTAGFFAGFVDNSVIFHRVADRVAAGSGVFGWMPRRARSYLAERLEKHTGAHAANILLGFMLGGAGAVGLVLGLPFDIRHVAFASSHSALAVLYEPSLRSATELAWIGGAVAIIGFVNFIVSFSLTLGVAVNARRLEGIDWRAGFRGVLALVRENPGGFFLPGLRDRRPAG